MDTTISTIDDSLPSIDLSVDDEYARNCLKLNYKKFYPHNLVALNNLNQTIDIRIPSLKSYICLRDAYICLELLVNKADGVTPYEDDNAVSLCNYGPLALFSEASLTTHNEKHLERVANLHESVLMRKLLSADGEELGGYFSKDTLGGVAVNVKLRNRLINNNHVKGQLHCKIPLRDIFGFALHQSKISIGLGYTVSLKRQHGDHAIFRTMDNGADDVNISTVSIQNITLNVPFYTMSMENDLLINKHLTSNNPNSSMSYIETSSSVQLINQNDEWSYTMGVQSGMERPIYIIVGFKLNTRKGARQDQNGGVFDNCPVRTASCSVGTERFPENEMQLNYANCKYYDAYNNIEEFKSQYLLSKNPPFISFDDYKTMYNIYVFDLRYQKEEFSAQPIQLNFKFDADVANNYSAYIVTMKERKIIVTSDGQQQSDFS